MHLLPLTILYYSHYFFHGVPFGKLLHHRHPQLFFLQYGDKRFQVTSNPENGIFLPSPFTEHLSHKLSLKQNSSVDERPFFSHPAGSSSLPTLHRGVFCQFPFRWIYYYGSYKSTGKESGKTHICALVWLINHSFFVFQYYISVSLFILFKGSVNK